MESDLLSSHRVFRSGILPHHFVRVRPCPSMLVHARPCSSMLVRGRPCSSMLVRARPCPSMLVRARPCPTIPRPGRTGQGTYIARPSFTWARLDPATGNPRGTEWLKPFREAALKRAPLCPRLLAMGNGFWFSPFPLSTLQYASARFSTLHHASPRFSALLFAPAFWRWETASGSPLFPSARFTTLHHASARFTTLHHGSARFSALLFAPAFRRWEKASVSPLFPERASARLLEKASAIPLDCPSW